MNVRRVSSLLAWERGCMACRTIAFFFFLVLVVHASTLLFFFARDGRF